MKLKLKKGVIFRMIAREKTVEISKDFFMFLLHLERFGLSTTPYRKYAEMNVPDETFETLNKVKHLKRLDWIICPDKI